MKVILSRKGFDSGSGGYSSPIMPDGRLISLPIPDNDSDISYTDLIVDSTTTYFQLMHSLNTQMKRDGKWRRFTKKARCHLDPDLDRSVFTRSRSWRGLFGQRGAAQTHLAHHHAQKDDIFLFFGWFRKTTYKAGKLIFDHRAADQHIMFGYLQIENIIHLSENVNIPTWMHYHPHNSNHRRFDSTNTLYVARRHASWNSAIPGYGTFTYHERLVLTKAGYCRSRWELPQCFRHVSITYHREGNWKQGYFQSAARGQEFVIDADANVLNWAKAVIEKFVVTN